MTHPRHIGRAHGLGAELLLSLRARPRQTS